MNSFKSGSRIVIVVAVIALACLASAAGIVALKQHKPARSNMAANRFGPVEIVNSGSTNTKPWDLVINTDGGGQVGSKHYPAGTFNTKQLVQDARRANLASEYSCARSTSFGSMETLKFDNKSVSGIDCYSDAPLAEDISGVLQKANLF